MADDRSRLDELYNKLLESAHAHHGETESLTVEQRLKLLEVEMKALSGLSFAAFTGVTFIAAGQDQDKFFDAIEEGLEERLAADD